MNVGASLGQTVFLQPDPTPVQRLAHLREAQAVARAALAAGHHPFCAVLVVPDHHTVLLRQGNVNTVNHAEAVLTREAAARFDAAYLWDCTLYTTVEPCCDNPTLDLPCREVFARGQKPVRVWGPVPELAEEIAALHRGFWQAPANITG